MRGNFSGLICNGVGSGEACSTCPHGRLHDCDVPQDDRPCTEGTCNRVGMGEKVACLATYTRR